jgi:hypothetical protein
MLLSWEFHFKLKYKTLAVRIIRAYYRPFLEFAGQHLWIRFSARKCRVYQPDSLQRRKDKDVNLETQVDLRTKAAQKLYCSKTKPENISVLCNYWCQLFTFFIPVLYLIALCYVTLFLRSFPTDFVFHRHPFLVVFSLRFLASCFVPFVSGWPLCSIVCYPIFYSIYLEFICSLL